MRKNSKSAAIRIVFSNEETTIPTQEGCQHTAPQFVEFDEKRQKLIFDKPIKEMTIDALMTIITYLPLKAGILYGNLATMTLRDNQGKIVAKLYILPNGKLADDSWLRNQGWK